MLSTKYNSFHLIFFTIVIADLIVLSLEGLSQIRIITKPLILISLIVYYLGRNKNYAQFNKLLLLALVCSLIGDILLIFEGDSQLFFMGGLISFLLAHISYSILFYRQRRKSRPSLSIGLILLIAGASLFYIIKNGLGELMVPVVIYTTVILTMVYMAFYRIRKSSIKCYNMIVAGAVTFMISDSLLAINKFESSFVAASYLIMLTYAIAQYLIVMGLIRYDQNS